MTRKSYGRPRHRVAYNNFDAIASDGKLAHTEVVAGLEWMERGHLDMALDRFHLAYRFLEEMLIRGGRLEREKEADET